MFNMIKLVRNEQMKIDSQLSNMIMMIALVLIVIIMGTVMFFMQDEDASNDWQAKVEMQNVQLVHQLENETLSEAVAKQYRQNLAINEYRLEHDIAPAASENMWSFVKTSATLTILVSLFTIVVAAGIVAGEFTWGTIKLLLIRPVTRSGILLSKYIAVLFYGLRMLVLLFLTSMVVGAILFGIADISIPYLSYANGEIVEKSMFSYVMTTYLLNCIDLLMMVTFAFMISTVFRSSSLSIGLALFLMFTGQQFVQLLSKYEWVKYILFANTNLTQYFEGTPIVEGMTLYFSIVTLFIYFLVFNLLSWYVFNKRDVI